jgi:DNA-binding Xre family transcriptional regulator/DNA-binding PadR family transcriptional regulator
LAKRTTYQELMTGIKVLLKKRALTYKDVAKELSLSESSVKRLFSSTDGQLSKIENICDWLEVSFSDLLALTQEDQKKVYILNEKQEDLFLKYPGALQFYLELIVYDYSVKEIKDFYNLTDESVYFYLNRLEEQKFIELHPNNKVKNLIIGEISPSGNTKLAKHLFKTMVNNIFKVSMDLMEKPETKNGKKHSIKTGELLLAESSINEVLKEYDDFRERIHKVHLRDCRLYPKRDLISHIYFDAILPQRMFSDRIPNV